MKKTVLILSTVCSLSISSVMASLPETPNYDGNRLSGMPGSLTVAFERFLSNPDTISPANFASARLNAFSIKAVRHFEKSFRNATEKQWYILVDGFVVYFDQDGVKKKAAYDESGNWLYSIFFYKKNRLPANVGRLIDQEYFNYTTSMVFEIQKDFETVYLVKMENTRELITVRVWQDEMEVVENFRKSLN